MSQADPDELRELWGREVAGLRDGLRYRLGQPIGRGSQAVTFRAARTAGAGPEGAVVKVWRPSLVRGAPDVARLVLRKESVALARLDQAPHPAPNVVRMIDSGEVSAAGLSLPWIALEYVHGGRLGTDLRERVEQAVRETGVGLGPNRAWRVIGGVFAGVCAIHALGVVHRDLKPSNVLLTGEGQDEIAKVGDFGVSRPAGMATTFGAHVSVGSVGYAAPEQSADARVGPWSDVFSLAALTYFALAGEPMFAGSLHVVLAMIQKGAFTPLASRTRLHPAWRAQGVLGPLDVALRAATVANPRVRIPSAEELWAALRPPFQQAWAWEQRS